MPEGVHILWYNLKLLFRWGYGFFLLSPSLRRRIRPFRETDMDSMEQRHRVRSYPTPRLRKRFSQTRNLISITQLGPCSCRVRSPAMKGGNVTARPLYSRVMREGRRDMERREGGRPGTSSTFSQHFSQTCTKCSA